MALHLRSKGKTRSFFDQDGAQLVVQEKYITSVWNKNYYQHTAQEKLLVGAEGGVSANTGQTGCGANGEYTPQAFKAKETAANPMTWQPPMPRTFDPERGHKGYFLRNDPDHPNSFWGENERAHKNGNTRTVNRELMMIGKWNVERAGTWSGSLFQVRNYFGKDGKKIIGDPP